MTGPPPEAQSRKSRVVKWSISFDPWQRLNILDWESRRIAGLRHQQSEEYIYMQNMSIHRRMHHHDSILHIFFIFVQFFLHIHPFFSMFSAYFAF